MRRKAADHRRYAAGMTDGAQNGLRTAQKFQLRGCIFRLAVDLEVCGQRERIGSNIAAAPDGDDP